MTKATGPEKIVIKGRDKQAAIEMAAKDYKIADVPVDIMGLVLQRQIVPNGGEKV